MKTARQARAARPTRQVHRAAAGGGGGSAPATIATGDVVFDNNSGTVTSYTAPATVNAGDVLVLFQSTIGATGALAIDSGYEYGAGWTQIYESGDIASQSAWRAAIWTKTALGTETGSLLINMNGGSFEVGMLIRLDGAGVCTQATGTHPSNLVSATSVDITPTNEGRVLSMAYQYNSSTAWVASTDVVAETTANNSSNIVCDEGVQPAGTPFTTGTFSNSVSRAQCGVFAVLVESA